MEIERKWLFDDLSVMDLYKKQSCVDYAQGYLSVNPEVRIRRKHVQGTDETTYKVCFKSKGH